MPAFKAGRGLGLICGLYKTLVPEDRKAVKRERTCSLLMQNCFLQHVKSASGCFTFKCPKHRNICSFSEEAVMAVLLFSAAALATSCKQKRETVFKAACSCSSSGGLRHMGVLHTTTRLMPAGCLVPFPLFSHTRSLRTKTSQFRRQLQLLSAGMPQVREHRFPGPRSSAGTRLRGTEPHATELSLGNAHNRSALSYGPLQRSPEIKRHYVLASGEHHRHGSPSKLAGNQLIFTQTVKSPHEAPVANFTLPLLNVCIEELL